jgi:hypothetical protein
MTAAIVGRNTVQVDTKPIPDYVVAGVEVSSKIFQGTMVGLASTGYAIMAGNAGTAVQKVIGRAEGPGDTGLNGDIDNSTGAAGALTVRVRQGAFYYVNNGSSITALNIGQPCYAATDVSVDLSSSGGTRPFAGIIMGVDTSLGVLVQMGLNVQFSGNAVIPAYNTCTSVATAALAAYTRVGGVITANGNGTIGAVFDGVAAVNGQVVFLPEGIAVAAADAGPYTITSVGAGGAPFVLTRPSWYADGQLIPMGYTIEILPGGTLFGATTWKSFVANATQLVDTNAPLFWPRSVTFSQALVAGTFTLTTVPVRSATLSTIQLTRIIANTSTNTVGGYWPTSAGANGITPGVLGTASVICQACVAAGTINVADISTMNVRISNW